MNGGVIDGKQIWYPQGEIASGVGAKRHQVRFGDLDGDGRAEYLFVHDNGAVESWRNVGATDNAYPGRVTWVPQGTIATGIGKDGDGVRFADLNGKRERPAKLSTQGGSLTPEQAIAATIISGSLPMAL